MVVVADDDPAMRLLCRVNLELEGYAVVEASSGEEIEEALASGNVALVLLDIHLGADDGIQIAHAIGERDPPVPVVFLSGSVRFGSRAAALSAGAIRKPFALEELIETVNRLART